MLFSARGRCEESKASLTRFTMIPPMEWQRKMMGLSEVPESYGFGASSKTSGSCMREQGKTYPPVSCEVGDKSVGVMVDAILGWTVAGQG